MIRFDSLFLPAAAIILTASCSMSGNRHEPVPRPEAYPRVAVLDTVYVSSDSTALRFNTNASAILKIRSPYWFDIIYPAYGATVYVTLSRVQADSIPGVVANRRERISLNTGDNETDISAPIISGDFTSYIYKSVPGRSTPLQFLSSDGKQWVASGTVFFSGVRPDSPVDSLAPMVAQIERDLIHGLSNISER